MSNNPSPAPHGRRTAALVFVVAGLLAGCATDPFRALPPGAYPATVELRDTPFYPQEKYQCGPAALATVLTGSGVTVHPDELISKVYIPEREGTLQTELLAASREYGRIPYIIAPEFSALLAEVADGRPVLVLQNLGVKLMPAWHYAVVVGFSPATSEIVLRSGTDKRRVTPAGIFANTWQRSDNWGMVLLRPGELPAAPDRDGYLKAVAAAESAGQFDLAAPAWRAATERWPDSAVAYLGLGNAAFGRGEMKKAERWYRRALELDPRDAATLNNLATAVAGQGRCREAAKLIQSALGLARLDSPVAAALTESEAEIAACKSPAGD